MNILNLSQAVKRVDSGVEKTVCRGKAHLAFLSVTACQTDLTSSCVYSGAFLCVRVLGGGEEAKCLITVFFTYSTYN